MGAHGGAGASPLESRRTPRAQIAFPFAPHDLDVWFSEQELPGHCRRVIADPALEGQAISDVSYQALVVRPQLAAKMLSQRQVVRIVGRWQTEGVGQDKRLKVQPHEVA